MMNYQKIQDTYVVRLDRGEEIMTKLTELAEEEGIRLATVYGLGAVTDVEMGFYDVTKKQYYANTFSEDYEVLHLNGNVTTKDGAPYLHVHLTIADSAGRTFGGHLNKATIAVTGEIFVRVLEGTVARKMDETIGINLMEFVE
ncbi:DNA-binding protein [Peptoniphilus equinus]|uniref:DNA-binding protein n=1 Tax=Peptoniphilus equinus TaxID=3016343 RepID=A0ABY7QSP4_9FIRM|nr:PPC domain-containing DNA-binding protein [Peptoniphilus equinus]WBW49794.1 DNA-binding protein [Peptoniphilus equinus]